MPLSTYRYLIFAAFILMVPGTARADATFPVRYKSKAIPLSMGEDITLPCAIGSTSGMCTVDTGSNKTWISQRAETAHFKKLRSSETRTANGTITLATVLTPEFSLGKGKAMVYPDLETIRSEAMPGSPKILGIAGADLLIGKIFIFDLIRSISPEKTQLYFLDADDRDYLSKFKNLGKIIYPSGRMEIEVLVDGSPVRALWDTHMVTAFSKSYVKAHPELFKKVGSGSSRDVAGKVAENALYKFSGEICITTVCARYSRVRDIESDVLFSGTGTADMVIGLEYLNKLSWYFNYENQTYSAIRE